MTKLVIKMTKFHGHMYKIESKAEIDIEADNEQEAQQKALAKTDELEFGKSDTKYVAFDII
jgi:hypothetical protein